MPAAIPEISRTLSVVRRRLRGWLTIRAFSRSLTALLVTVSLSFAIDRLFRLERSQRVAVLVLGAAGLLWTGWRHCLRPLVSPVTDESIAHRLERAFPQCRGLLLNAMQFAAAATPRHSPELATTIVTAGRNAVAQLDLTPLLDTGAVRRNGIVCTTVLLLFAIAVAAFPATAGLWFQRNVLLTDRPWPRRTHLHLEGLRDGILTVPFGGDLTVAVTSRGARPRGVWLQTRDRETAGSARQLPLTRDGVFRTTFTDVTQPFSIRLSGGDHRTEWIPVEVLPRPELDRIVLTALPPPYTGLAPFTVKAGSSVCELPAGSALRITARANHPLQSVSIHRDNATVLHQTLPATRQIALELSPETLTNGTYLVHVTDDRNVPALRPVPIPVRLLPDRPPKVDCLPQGIGPLVLARAVVPLHITARDDHGIAALALEHRIQTETGETTEGTRLGIPAKGEPHPETGHLRLAAVEHHVEIAALALAPGAHLWLRAGARDTNPDTDARETLSSSVAVRIVTEPELRDDLRRREQELRSRFEQLVNRQRDLLDASRLFARDRHLDPRRCLQAERRQRQIHTAAIRSATAFRQLRDEVRNNRLEALDGPLYTRLDTALVTPFAQLTDHLLPQAGDTVAEARAQLAAGESSATTWQRAATRQRQALALMVQLRDKMVRSAGIHAAIRALETIIEQQKLLRNETTRQAEENADAIFDN